MDIQLWSSRHENGIMHVWDESTALRGSSEVCSCLESTLSSRHRKATHLVLFSDGCCGQNKNKAMLTFLSSFCAKQSRKYKRVDHFFLVRGHTFLPNDRDFALIEKRKKKESPKVPSDYVNIIEASRTSQPFLVKQVNGNDIKDYKGLADKSVKTSLISNTGEKVQMRSVMWFSYGESEEMDPVTGVETTVEHPDEVWCRYTHNPLESWKKINPFKRNVKAGNLEAGKKYTKRVPIKSAKYKDLISLVDKGLLSEDVGVFYANLPHDGEPNDAESEFEDDYVE